MIEKIVNNLLDTQIKSGLLKDETIPIYRYGYTLLIEVTINVILSLLIGFALGEIGIVILFNLIFIPLRGFCGGWHAGKSWLCTMTSAIVLLFSVFVGKDQLFQYGTNLWMILMGISCLTIWFLAPMDSETKRLSDEEIAQLLVLDIKDASYFQERGVSNQHGGGNLFAQDQDIMGWLFQQR